MAAYYNEFDPAAAQWLRNLIDAGLIAPGVVDDRSIEDVTPADLLGFAQVHFFAGIGGWSLALRQAGWPDDKPVWTGSCPCQPFSAAGAGAGFADERHLWPAMFWLAREHRPDVIFGEQVDSKAALAWLDLVFTDLEGEGYTCGATDFCAASVGAPHRRQRLYWVADASSCGRAIRTGPTPQDNETSSFTTRPELLRKLPSRPEGCGSTIAVADANGRQSSDRDIQRSGQYGFQPQGSGVIGMAEPLSAGRAEGGTVAGNGQVAGSREPSALADSERSGLRGRRAGEEGDECGAVERPERLCPSCTVDDPAGARSTQERCGKPAESEGRTSGPELGRPTNGFWRDAEWLPCTDGKARPVEPGVTPLAYGVPGRVVKLRAYGNAICIAQAAEFIRAYGEALNAR